MTARKRWTLTLIAFGIIAGLLTIAATAQMLFSGARIGAFEWMRNSTQMGVRAFNDREHQSLTREGAALRADPETARALREANLELLGTRLRSSWVFLERAEFWIAIDGSGAVFSSRPECQGDSALAALAVGPAPRFLLCRGTPMLVAAMPAAPGDRLRLFVGDPLDAAYVDELVGVSNAEIAVMGASGYVASSLQDQEGQRVAPAISAASLQPLTTGAPPYFAVVANPLAGYRGFPNSGGMLAQGASPLPTYVYATSIDPEHPEFPVSLVIMVPTLVMELGPRFTLAGVAICVLLIVLTLALVGWWLVIRFTEPLAVLARVAERVGNGELHLEVPVVGDEEVRTLGRAFKDMVDRLDARAIQSAKMAAVGQLAGGVAHEINNPLGVILGFAQGMERRVAEGDPLQLPVRSIVREALRCKNLVQELLTFSRAAGRTKEALDLNGVVRSTAVLLDARARTQGVELSLELAGDTLPLQANSTQLQQIIVNLGTNALDAMQSGGRLTLRTRSDQSGAASLQVVDTGAGIPQELRERIFEPFFTTKGVGKGTGLGLSLVYEIVQQHQGSLEVESEVGRGSTFSVSFPAKQVAAIGAARS